MKIKKALFIHIAKCAGLSIADVCRANNIVVDTLNQTWNDIDASNELYADYYKFIFIRNPWDRMVSCWAMFSTWRTASWLPQFNFRDFLQVAFETNDIKKISTRQLWKINPKNEQEISLLTEEYIKSIRNHSCPYLHPFCKVYNKESKKFLVDYIGRFENLQDDFNLVCSIVGIPQTELIHKNKSTHKPYWEYYTDETIEIVADTYKEEIEIFNYKFGE